MLQEPEGKAFEVKHETKLLQDGVRLVVRFNEEARDFLISVGLEGAMKEKEIDRILVEGASTSDMMSIRSAWKTGPDTVWKALAQEWSRRHPNFRTWDGNPAQPYSTTKLVSFGVDEVVYEVGVRIDDGDY